MADSFAVYISLGWLPWIWLFEIHCPRLFWLQSFSWEISYSSDGFSFSGICSFLLTSSIFFLHSVYLSLLTVICYGKFLFWSFLLGALYSSCICIDMCFFFVCLFCFYHLVENVVYANNPEFFPLAYAYNSTIWSFHGVAYFPYVLFLFPNSSLISLNLLLAYYFLIFYILLNSFHS